MESLTDILLLEGRACNLRPLRGDDAETTLKWRLSQRASLLNRGAGSVEEQKYWINNRPKSEVNFMIELKDGTPVGMLSLIKIDMNNKTAESARFLIGEEEKVKGVPVAVESMLLLYIYAFEKLNLNRIYGVIAEENKMMVKWQKYLGMSQEGILREHYCIDNKFQDGIAMGLLKSEYYSKAEKRMKVLAAW